MRMRLTATFDYTPNPDHYPLGYSAKQIADNDREMYFYDFVTNYSLKDGETLAVSVVPIDEEVAQ